MPYLLLKPETWFPIRIRFSRSPSLQQLDGQHDSGDDKQAPDDLVTLQICRYKRQLCSTSWDDTLASQRVFQYASGLVS